MAASELYLHSRCLSTTLVMYLIACFVTFKMHAASVKQAAGVSGADLATDAAAAQSDAHMGEQACAEVRAG